MSFECSFSIVLLLLALDAGYDFVSLLHSFIHVIRNWDLKQLRSVRMNEFRFRGIYNQWKFMRHFVVYLVT